MDEQSGILKFLRNVERRAHIQPSLPQAFSVSTASSQLSAPVIQPTLLRLPSQKVQILLPHKELRTLQRIGFFCSTFWSTFWSNGHACKHGIRLVCHQREGSIHRRKHIVRSCRRHRVEPTCFQSCHRVEPTAVRDRANRLCATQHRHRSTRYRLTLSRLYLAANS